MSTANSINSLIPNSIQKGTGAYTIPAGYHGLLSASEATGSASAGGTVGGTSTWAKSPRSGPQVRYYGWGGSGGGSGSASAVGSGQQWLNAGTAITTAVTNTGTTSTDGSAKLSLDGQVYFGALSKGITNHTGSGAAVVFIGWTVSLFLSNP